MSQGKNVERMTEDRPRLPTLDELWERSAHGTHREDLQAAFDLGKAEGIQQERARLAVMVERTFGTQASGPEIAAAIRRSEEG